MSEEKKLKMEEKKLDLNSIIGFVLIFGILIWIMYQNKPSEATIAAEKAKKELVAKEKAPTATPDELLTTAEVCTLLKVTRGALHNYKTKGLIPAHRLGAKVRFKKSEVLAALHSIKTKRGK